MTSYVITSSDGTIIGPYANLGLAQAAANQLRVAHIAGDPTNLTGQNTSTLYAAVRTKQITRAAGGINIVTSIQEIDSSWAITALTAP